MKAELNPITVIGSLLLIVILLMVVYVLYSQFGDKASDTLNTAKPGSGGYIFEDYYVPNITIDNLYASRVGTDITVRIDMTSTATGSSDVNFVVRSYPGSMVEEKVERQLIGEGSETLTMQTKEKTSGSYYIIVEIRTLGGSLVAREGKWMGTGDTGYVPGSTTTTVTSTTAATSTTA